MPLEFVNPHRYIAALDPWHMEENHPVRPLPWPKRRILHCVDVDNVTYWFKHSTGRWVEV